MLLVMPQKHSRPVYSHWDSLISPFRIPGFKLVTIILLLAQQMFKNMKITRIIVIFKAYYVQVTRSGWALVSGVHFSYNWPMVLVPTSIHTYTSYRWLLITPTDHIATD